MTSSIPGSPSRGSSSAWRGTVHVTKEAKEFGIVNEIIEHRPIALVSDAIAATHAAAGDNTNATSVSASKGKDEDSS